MTTETKPTKIIPKDKAVFWMDDKGAWHNAHGPFEHPKIIQYFNRSIQRDAEGFFLCQEMEHAFEKVYFPFEETALFVADVSAKNPGHLLLNTGKKMLLDPAALFIRDDSLFIRMPDHLIKFTSRALLKLSKHISEVDGALVLTLASGSHPIPEDSFRGQG